MDAILDDASGTVQHFLPHLRGLAPATTLTLFVAWTRVRLLALREDAQRDPEVLATTVASPLAAALLEDALVAARRHLPRAGMTAGSFWRAVAGLGGFLGCKRDGPPGWLTLWRGWMIVCEWCWSVDVECATGLL